MIDDECSKMDSNILTGGSVRENFLKSDRLRRVVIKVGSSLLFDKEHPEGIHANLIASLRDDILYLRERGIEVMLVTSGAVQSGRHFIQKFGIRPHQRPSLERRQALSALGQDILMAHYRREMSKAGIPVAQLLLTARDFRDRRAYLNIEHTLQELIKLNALAIVNENDTVATDELQFGENDLLSAACAALFHAQLLVILTSADGFMLNGSAVRELQRIEALHWQAARGPEGPGSGGMLTKLRAGELCMLCGISLAILPGQTPRPLYSLLEGAQIGTFISNPKRIPMSARKRWILFARTQGTVIVDSGACKALTEKGSSLLPAGVCSIRGKFLPNEAVEIEDRQGGKIGRGIIYYSYREILPMLQLSAEEIRKRNLAGREQVLIHRNNLVLEKG